MGKGRKIISILSATVIIAYIIWAMYLLIVHPTDVYIVSQGRISKEDETSGYIIRNEKVQKGENYTNGIYAIASEGQRVAINEPIFRYYSDEEKEITNQISDLNYKIQDLLEKEKMSRYRLSKESGVAMTTITDICNGKADLDKCTAGTLHKIAKVLNVTVDAILENNSADNVDYRYSFETFKSNTCHHVKDMGDIDFIIETLETDEVRKLYERRWCREAMYLLAMIDYLSRMNDVPLCTNYNDIRSQKLEKLYFSAGVEVAYAATGDERIKEKALANAIPEFIRFNIVDSEVRNVC